MLHLDPLLSGMVSNRGSRECPPVSVKGKTPSNFFGMQCSDEMLSFLQQSDESKQEGKWYWYEAVCRVSFKLEFRKSRVVSQ